MTSHDVAVDIFMTRLTNRSSDMDDDVRELLKEIFRETVEKVFPLKEKKEKSSEQEESSSESAEASSEEEKPKRTKKGKQSKQSKPRKEPKKSAYSYFRSEMMKGKAKNGKGLTMKEAADLWNKEYKGKKASEKYQKLADAYNKEHGL
jgi:hypothetical protein